MSILIGLIPALAWGLLPISVSKIGGRPVNQILGTTMGTLLVAALVYMHFRPGMTAVSAALSALSGALWAVGQIGQYHAFTRIGVSGTMPVSAGLQLVGTALIGVLAFGEWPSPAARGIGFTALAAVVLGIVLTSLRDRSGSGDKPGGRPGAVDKTALLLLFFTNFGFLAYSALPDMVDAKGTAIFLPQAAGMAGAAVAYAVISGQTPAFKEAVSWKNLLSGFLFSIAALFYILSAQLNGIATGFVLAQLSVFIATVAGIVILKERKTPFELKATAAGLALIVLGGTSIAFL